MSYSFAMLTMIAQQALKDAGGSGMTPAATDVSIAAAIAKVVGGAPADSDTLAELAGSLAGKEPAGLAALTKAKLRAASLLTRFAPADTNPIPAVSTDVPTLSVGTAATVTARVIGPQSGQVTEVGSRGTWNTVSGRLDNLGPGVTGLDFYLTGTTVEVQFLANSAGAQPMWLFIDGKPMTAAPDLTSIGTVASGTTYFLKLAFAASARRRIELFIAPIAAWYAIRTDNATLVTPAPRKPVVGFVGDSFWAGSNGTPLMQSGAFMLARTLGVECYSFSYGGTGYASAGSFNTYGSATRTAAMAAAGAELVILSGSVNDDASSAAVGASAAAAFAAYATAVPNARLIVFGPQPSNAVDTISTARAASVAAIAAAATAAPNVIAFHDQIGTLAGVPAAINSGTTYPDGSLVTYKGSVFKLANGGATNSTANPATNAKWNLVTYAYLGTGNSGTPAADGTRDVYLYSDGVHPLPLGNAAFALQQAGIVRADLLAAAA